MKKLVIALVAVSMLFIGLGVFFYDMGVDNKEIDLRERFKGQIKVCMTSHDAMWKIINQDAEVTTEYKEAFEKIYPELISGRYANDNGTFMKWIQEQNPDFKIELYDELMKTIKDERTKFKRSQDICIDVSREYASYIKKKPANWFIDDEILDARELLKSTKEEVADMNLVTETKEAYDVLSYKPVTSTKTEDVFKSGKDDEVQLFKKDTVK